jgi:hypothetical protein
VLGNDFWKFNSITLTIDGEKINRPGNVAIADTGTTLCLLENKIVKKIYGKIPGST